MTRTITGLSTCYLTVGEKESAVLPSIIPSQQHPTATARIAKVPSSIVLAHFLIAHGFRLRPESDGYERAWIGSSMRLGEHRTECRFRIQGGHMHQMRGGQQDCEADIIAMGTLADRNTIEEWFGSEWKKFQRA